MYTDVLQAIAIVGRDHPPSHKATEGQRKPANIAGEALFYPVKEVKVKFSGVLEFDVKIQSWGLETTLLNIQIIYLLL